MSDRVLAAFLRKQYTEGQALVAESNLVQLTPLGEPANRYVAEFTCTGLVEAAPGRIEQADAFAVGIWFPDDYLRVVNPLRVVTWLAPRTIWHPNISATSSAVCVGRIEPGTSLVDLIYQVYEIITWQRVTMREDDALNHAACQWARAHRDRFPVDRRPLKRQPRGLGAAVVTDLETSDDHTC